MNRLDRDNWPADVVLSINSLTDEFASALKSPEQTSIETALAGAQADYREQLFQELLSIEIEHRPEKLQAAQDYLVRFPDFAATITRVLATKHPPSTSGEEITTDHPATSSQTSTGIASDDGIRKRNKYPSKNDRGASTIWDGPTRFANRYNVTGKISEGAFGIVLLGIDELLGRKIAIKVVQERANEDTSQERQFRQEARIVASLRHPNVIAVHDFGCDPDCGYFIVTDYIEGGTLQEVLIDPKLDPSRWLHLFSKIVAGLHCVHSRGLIHRDLKPSNILMDLDDNPVLADFGLALRHSVGTSLSSSLV